MKNFVLLFLSEVHVRDGRFEVIEYASDRGSFSGVQSNEPAVKYLLDKLEAQGETLDRIFLFATNKIKQPIKGLPEGAAMQSHLEFFGARLMEAYPQLIGCFHIIDYDEEQAVEASIEQVAKMARVVRDYMAGCEEEAVLHADMTGGFRHTSMMMLSVMQLLKYSGLRIGSVLYANFQKRYLEDVTEIHRTFELVSGAEEFVNFGSVKAINEYFAENNAKVKSRELKELLQAITAFSDAVRICRTGQFEARLSCLAEKIAAFESLGSKSVQETLFGEIIETIKKEYDGILGAEINRLDIIAWCVRKGFLQQAMTLFTEWVPLYIVQKKIYYPAPNYRDDIVGKCLAMNLNYKKWETVFVNDFSQKHKGKNADTEVDNTLAQSRKPWSKFRDSMFKAAKTGKKAVLEAPFTIQKIRLALAEIESLRKVDMDMRLGFFSLSDVKRKYPTVCRVISFDYEHNNNYKKGPEEYIKSHLNRDFLYNKLAGLPENFLEELFELHLRPVQSDISLDDADEAVKNIAKDKHSEQSIAASWRKRKKDVTYMLESCNALCDIDEGILYEILECLHWLRNQRNQINHAYDGVEVAGNDAITEKINRSLGLLKEVMK